MNQIQHNTFLSVCMSKINTTGGQVSPRNNRQRVDIYQSCRIFKNTKSNINKFFTLEEVKKGKIPIKDHILIASIDMRQSKAHPQKSRVSDQSGIFLNRPDPFFPSLASPEIFMSVESFEECSNMKGYRLSKEGDIIKIGQSRIRVLALVEMKAQEHHAIIDQSPRTHTLGVEHRKYWDSYLKSTNQIHGLCRICLSQETDVTDSMIVPCECKGTCSTVHLSCLRQWVSQRVTYKISPVGRIYQYSTRFLKCEICQANLPKCILKEISSQQYSFLFETPSSLPAPYLVLEIEGRPAIYLMHPKTDLKQSSKILIGRSQQLDVPLADSQISAIQCQIKFELGCFFLKDLHSKFGTYVSLREQIEIKSRLEIQTNGVHYQLKVEQTPKDFMNEDD